MNANAIATARAGATATLVGLLLAAGIAARGAAQDAPPACAGGNSALMLVGLDRTADYRQQNDFTIEENGDTYASYLDPVRLTMRDEATGRVFYEDPAATLNARYAIWLDPGDGPAVVSISYVEV